MNRRYLEFTVVAACSSLFIGCSKTYLSASHSINRTVEQIAQATSAFAQPQPPVISKPGYYIDTNAVPLDHSPTWAKQNISLHARQLPLNLLMTRLMRYHPININYAQTVLTQKPISIDYDGSLQGALDTIASSTNYTYTLSNHQLSWDAYQTKTFDISFMPGTSDYRVGQSQNVNTNASSDTQSNRINDQQYSNLHGALSIWHDLEATINQLKSKQGRLFVSESTTTVTVHDHPSNLIAIEHYIEKMNHILSQQVAIKVQVLDVALDRDFQFGIDWKLLTKAFDTKFNISSRTIDATNLVRNSLLANNHNSGAASLDIGPDQNALIRALNQQGKVRIVTEPEVVTLNNQIAAIRITQNVGYIKSVSQTSNQFTSTNAINPGNISDGFTLFLLPKIQKNDVFMQISSTIANLQKLEKISNAPDKNHTHNNNTQYQAIQVPTLNQKSFNQRSLVASGSTLIIAGYKRLEDTMSSSSPIGIDPLGGRGASSHNIETLVLITPTILHSRKSNVHVNTQ